MQQKTSQAFVSASWLALATGLIGYLIGIWRADMLLNEKGYYFTILMFGLFGVVSLQKSVRDRMEGIRVSDLYYNLCWFGVILSISLLVIGLWNATMLPSEKGYYAFAFILAMYSAVAVQKNVRDNERTDFEPAEPDF